MEETKWAHIGIEQNQEPAWRAIDSHQGHFCVCGAHMQSYLGGLCFESI